MRLQPPDQLTVALLWVTAIFMATQAAIEKWPTASESLSGLNAWWLSWFPLGLLALAGFRQLRAPTTIASEDVKAQPPASEGATDTIVPVIEQPRDPSTLPNGFVKQFEDLMFSKPTKINIKRFLEPYNNKFALLNLRLGSINTLSGKYLVQAYFVRGDERAGPIWIYFDKVWEDHLNEIRHNEAFKCMARVFVDGEGESKFVDGSIMN